MRSRCRDHFRYNSRLFSLEVFSADVEGQWQDIVHLIFGLIVNFDFCKVFVGLPTAEDNDLITQAILLGISLELVKISLNLLTLERRRR